MSTSRAWRALVCLTSTTMALLAACGPEIPDGLLEEFRDMAGQQAREARQRETIVVEGLDGWLFFGPELRHVSVGRFWGEEATAVSQARDPATADPLPAILDFQRQLAALGVELLVVPVPPKSIIYPEKVSSAVDVPIPVPRLDPDHQRFYALLREAGVDVLDLTETFIDNRFHPEGTVYCRQDTHWSGVGCMLAAQVIAPLVRERAWFSDLDTAAFAPRWFSSAITGDLFAALDTPAVTREELRLRGIASTGVRATEVPSDPHSPIVLLGDSHALVFNDGGDMHATGAGLADQLAFELGVPMDLIAVRGSGATSARVNLLRRAQRDDAFWDGKRLVIWCFAARELTEGDGWALVPVVPD